MSNIVTVVPETSFMHAVQWNKGVNDDEFISLIRSCGYSIFRSEDDTEIYAKGYKDIIFRSGTWAVVEAYSRNGLQKSIYDYTDADFQDRFVVLPDELNRNRLSSE